MTTTATPKKSKPTHQKGRRKSEAVIDAGEGAKDFLREAMTQRGVGVEGLATLLAGKGVTITPGALANKISRGGFSAAFLFQCADALELDLETTGR